MGYVQLAQPFACHLGKVKVVVDMGKEAGVVVAHGIPVHTVHVHMVEAFLLLAIDTVEHVFAFGRQVHIHLSADGNAGVCAVSALVLSGFAAKDEHVLHLLVPLERTGHVVEDNLVAAVAQVELPHVIAAIV